MFSALDISTVAPSIAGAAATIIFGILAQAFATWRTVAGSVKAQQATNETQAKTNAALGAAISELKVMADEQHETNRSQLEINRNQARFNRIVGKKLGFDELGIDPQ